MKINAKLDIKKYKNNDRETINNKFVGACVKGDVNLVNFLLESKGLSYYPNLEKVRLKSFEGASIKGGLEMYKLLEEIYATQKMEISSGDFRTVCIKNLPGMIEYLLPKTSLESSKSGFNVLFKQDKLNIIKNHFNSFNIKLEDEYFKTAWGYAPNVFVWMITEQNYIIDKELEEWMIVQPTVVMKSMEPVFLAIKIRGFNNKLNEELTTKSTIKKTIKKL